MKLLLDKCPNCNTLITEGLIGNFACQSGLDCYQIVVSGEYSYYYNMIHYNNDVDGCVTSHDQSLTYYNKISNRIYKVESIEEAGNIRSKLLKMKAFI